VLWDLVDFSLKMDGGSLMEDRWGIETGLMPEEVEGREARS
jgi:hypothetical protein